MKKFSLYFVSTILLSNFNSSIAMNFNDTNKSYLNNFSNNLYNKILINNEGVNQNNLQANNYFYKCNKPLNSVIIEKTLSNNKESNNNLQLSNALSNINVENKINNNKEINNGNLYWHNCLGYYKLCAKITFENRLKACENEFIKILTNEDFLKCVKNTVLVSTNPKANIQNKEINNINQIICLQRLQEEFVKRKKFIYNNSIDLNDYSWNTFPISFKFHLYCDCKTIQSNERFNRCRKMHCFSKSGIKYCQTQLMRQLRACKLHNISVYDTIRCSLKIEPLVYEYNSYNSIFEKNNKTIKRFEEKDNIDLSVLLYAIEIDLLNGTDQYYKLLTNYMLTMYNVYKNNLLQNQYKIKTYINKCREYFNYDQNTLLNLYLVNNCLFYNNDIFNEFAEKFLSDFILIDIFKQIRGNDFFKSISKYNPKDYLSIAISEYKKSKDKSNTKYSKNYLYLFNSLLDKNSFTKIVKQVVYSYISKMYINLITIDKNSNEQKTLLSKVFTKCSTGEYRFINILEYI